MGLYLHLKKDKKWITNVLYEFTNTRQQSVKDSLYEWNEYGAPYKPVQNQFSGLFEVQYSYPGFPLEIGMAAGVDTGNTIDSNFGFQFSVAKRW